MPKKRTDKLPPYVYKRKYGYVLRIYTGKNQPMRSVKLCAASAPLSEVWQQYEKLEKEEVQTLKWLFNLYENSPQFQQKTLNTRKSQSQQINRINLYTMRNGKKFGGVEIKNITSGVIRKYLDARQRDGSPTAGNREKSLISTAWNWALQRDKMKGTNPCVIVDRNPETPRTRYVTLEEYSAAYKLAEKYPYLQPAMEMAYLCRMRREETLAARRSQILEIGFDTLRLKGSQDAITLWSKRLKQAVNYKAGKVKSLYIIHDKRGQRITKTAFASAWRRLKQMMKQAGIEPFNFHDLKAMGVSNFEGDKLKASGHKDSKMLKVYDRKKIEVEATE